MCGVVAVVSLVAGREALSREALARAVASLHHRGPDERGLWLAPHRAAALGHARLSILDLDTGRQPIESRCAPLVISHNGEFYDHDRLRRELGARGHALATRSDSEIALHLYEEEGLGFLQRLRGEYAFALWDDRARRLVAARDRFGIRPLFYAEHDGRVFVASEMKALFAAGLPARWDAGAWYDALHFAGATDGTLFHGVRQVPPGHALVVESGRASLVRYWDVDYPGALPAASPPPEADAVASFRARLDEAVRLRVRADVPVACYLSGGVDSSVVVALTAKHAPRPTAAFTVAFEDPDYDEGDIAARMAAHAGVPHVPIRMRADDYADAFEAVVGHAEGFVLNGHAPARYLMSRAVRDAGFKVVLGGEGADEVFAGYHFIARALGQSSAPRRGALARALSLVAPIGRGEAHVRAASRLLFGGARLLGFPPELTEALGARFGALRALLHPDLVRAHRGRDPYWALLRSLPWARQLAGRPAYRVLLYGWLKTFFPNYVLAGERMDMAHGVESRLPFLDHPLFEAARALPASLLFRDGTNKYLLRRVAADLVTPEVLAGPKRPFFGPPTAASATHPLGARVRELLGGQALDDLPFLSRRAAIALANRAAKASVEEQRALDPLLYLLGSAAVLQRTFRPSSG